MFTEQLLSWDTPCLDQVRRQGIKADAALQEEDLMRAFVRVEMPLVHVLQCMETVGIAVDPASLAKHKVSWKLTNCTCNFCIRLHYSAPRFLSLKDPLLGGLRIVSVFE